MTTALNGQWILDISLKASGYITWNRIQISTCNKLMTHQCFKLMRDFCWTWPQSCWKEKSASFHCFQKTKMRHLSHQCQLLQDHTTCLAATRHMQTISTSAFSKMSEMFLLVHQILSNQFCQEIFLLTSLWTDNCCHNRLYCILQIWNTITYNYM